MAKRQSHEEDPDMETLRREMSTLTRRMEELITIIVGNSSYGVVGIKNDFRDLKTDVQTLKSEIEKMKRDNEDREKRQGFISIKLETIPQKIVGLIGFAGIVLTIIQSIKTLFTQEP